MRNILFAFLFLLPALVRAQDTITYTFALDTISSDSFFLLETVSRPQPGLPRPIETTTPYYFFSTEEFDRFILLLKNDSVALDQQVKYILDAKDAMKYKLARIQCLRDSVFKGYSCGTGVGSRMALAPPSETVETMQPTGYWMLYSDGQVEYLPDGTVPERGGRMLLPSGNSVRVMNRKTKKKNAN